MLEHSRAMNKTRSKQSVGMSGSTMAVSVLRFTNLINILDFIAFDWWTYIFSSWIFMVHLCQSALFSRFFKHILDFLNYSLINQKTVQYIDWYRFNFMFWDFIELKETIVKAMFSTFIQTKSCVCLWILVDKM